MHVEPAMSRFQAMSEPDYAAINARARELWGLGEYQRIADLILPISRALVDACFISAGQEVLDVAAGNGNLAVVAGEEGASVVASDISPGQIELGRARTAAEGLDVEWVEANAEELPFEDDRFDCAASVFGAMFAPRPELVASELFRVVKPGGTVGMANWGPYGSQGELFEVMSKYGPPLPEGVALPRKWGLEEIVEERLGPYASSLQMERVTTRWQFESFEHAMQTFGSAGPGVAQRQQMEPEKLAQMGAEARELMERHNKATDGTLVVEPEYLQVVARKRG
jgi:ubiquinone/menaquinone biosynthesis C-methylase UbiE